MSLLIVAGKPQTSWVGTDEDGHALYEHRDPGDPMPEAASWPSLGTWISSGHVIVKEGVEELSRDERERVREAGLEERTQVGLYLPPSSDPDDDDDLPSVRMETAASRKKRIKDSWTTTEEE